jgi:hypothetical protein
MSVLESAELVLLNTTNEEVEVRRTRMRGNPNWRRAQASAGEL